MQSASAAGGGRGRGPGSFPLSEELLDIETWDIALLSSADGIPEDINSAPRAPGHHRATMLLDGISCSSSGGSSTGSSARSTPAGSFDGTSAQRAAASVASSTAAGQPLMPAGAGGASFNGSTANLSGATDSTLQSSSCGNISTSNPSTSFAPAASSTEQQSPAGTMSAQSAQSLPAEASSSRSSAGHAAPSTLQLPDFSAFTLPEECTFTESSMDDALMTPTPHTPVVPNMFAGDGLPTVAARTCRPHYTSSGNSSANSSSSGSNSSSLSGGSNSGAGCYSEPGAAAAGGGDSGDGSSGMQQLGTCRALLIDNGEDEFELDPFPAAIVPSPSSSRHHAGGGGWQTYAGLEMLQNGSWESSQGFTSILCRRTLSTVSEATHEGIDSESPSSTPSATQTGASPEHHHQPASPQHQQQQPVEYLIQQQDHQQPQQQQQQQQGEEVLPTVTVSENGSLPEAHQQWCDPVGRKELPHGLTPAASPRVPPSSNSSSMEGTCAAAQQASQQADVVQPAASCAADAAADVDSAAVVLALCTDVELGASLEQQQQVAAADQEAAAAAFIGAAAEGSALPLPSGAAAGSKWQQQQGTAAAAEGDMPACLLAVADKVGSGSGSGSGVCVIDVVADATAAATAAAAGDSAVTEDVWEAANKQRLQQLLVQQEQQHQQAPTYPALEAQLLAAVSGSSSSSSSGPGQQQQQQCRFRQVPLLQRLLLCGCNSGAAGSQQLQQQCQQVLQLAKIPFCNDSSLHLALLQAVHSAYTGTPGPVPRLGPHWAALGFQGDDPATDLRGAGVLGLLQLLYLHWHDAAAADRIFKLAQSPQQEFPLAIVSINVTAWTLEILRSGQLDRAAQRLGGHMAAANSFYCGAMYEFYRRWLKGNKTMLDSGIVLKQLERFCSSHCKQMLKLAENRQLS